MIHDSTSVTEAHRHIPMIRSVDVLVAGMGPAGIAAGIAAAREGAKTLIIERYGYPGGMITGSNVVAVLGVGDGRRPRARGITQDIRERLELFKAVNRVTATGDYWVDAEVFKWQALEMLEECGAQFLLHTLACDPIIEGDCMVGVFTESKNGRQAILSRVVIDCTADADLAFRAGCPCENQTHDVTLRILVSGVDRTAFGAFKKTSPSQAQAIMEEARKLNGGALPGATRYLKGIDITDAEALTKAEFEARRECFRALYFLRERMPGWADARVAHTAPQLGVRQSRRIQGVYTVTDEDLRSSRHFDDSVARLSSYLDGYKLYDPAGLDYDIPYRCLVPKKIDGLLVAGRCCSSDYRACNSLRLIVPCFATGQAAGTAAALAVRNKAQPRSLVISELQDALIRQNVYFGDDNACETGAEVEAMTDVQPMWDDAEPSVPGDA